jgi:hypothetical protein
MEPQGAGGPGTGTPGFLLEICLVVPRG